MNEQPKWRQDFPIDLPQDEYVSRRDFTKYLVLISFAFVIGQFWILVINWMRKRKGELPLRKIAEIQSIAPGKSITFDYPEKHDACILVRIDKSNYVAYSQKCTHLSCPVVPKIDAGEIHCPCHEGLFDLKSGQPLAGPPRRALARIKLEFRNSKIYAAGFERNV